ncbi:MAG: CDP-glycerol glycerophosphotransferase family protein [Lachnospiraceae bacterium]
MKKRLDFFAKRFDKMKKNIERARGKVKRGYFKQKRYVHYLETCPIEEYTILLESGKGIGMEWDIVELAKNFCRQEGYREYALWLTVTGKNKKNREAFLKENGLERVKVIPRGSFRYFKLLATAKYLINDGEFPKVFIKRPEQRYLNLWNAAAPRPAGRNKKKNYGNIGNRQRNFFAADYMIFSGEYIMEQVCNDYMLENMATAPAFLCGHPRNEAFFDEQRREAIRCECCLQGKQMYVYLPVTRKETARTPMALHRERMVTHLWYLDKLLTDGQVIYAKLPSYVVNAIDWGGMKHILPFPKGYKTYEFLNAADGLITDYSGVLFDYAVTQRKIVLFTYDRQEYLEENEFYLSWDELPFPQAQTPKELAALLGEELSCENSKFLRQFCGYERKGTADALCRLLLFGEEAPFLKKCAVPDNGKKNVVIFGGDFMKNGITTALLTLLNNIDRTRCNYVILYKIETLKKRQASLKELPEHVTYMGFHHAKSLSLLDIIRVRLPFYPEKKKMDLWHKQAEHDRHRVFEGCRVDKVIQYNGYVNDMIMMFREMPCSRTIYAHNDMDQEIRMKKNVNRAILAEAYRTYDSVAVVTPDLIPVTRQLAEYHSQHGNANIVVAKNLINYQKVLELANRELLFDAATKMNVKETRVREILNSDAKKMITIGRFSKEKGHFRLISAFERLNAEYPDVYLIILGGYGALYDATVAAAAASKAADRIVVIKYMSNPYALLAKCDYFVLSSFYEGFGLVLAEADILGLRCFSTDIVGPKQFMEQYGGRLVDNSEDGVLAGLRECMEGTLPEHLSVDYEQYNLEAIAQFESLIPSEET